MIQCGQPLAGTLLAVLTISSVDANQPMSSAAARSALGQTTQITTPLSPLDRQRAETWQISESEWRRYQSLMEGIRGSISPANLLPIEVLGIHARDEPERRRYAERWAQIMRDDAERILAFQHAYDAAWKRLFPAESLIDRAQLPAASTTDVELQSDDRVLFFTRPDCAVCDALLRRLLGKIREWLGTHRGRLAELGAAGMLVEAGTVDDLRTIARLAKGLPILPAPATDIARALGLEHIPVLISRRGIEQ